MRSLYDFIHDSYDFRQPLWASARLEAKIMSNLCPFAATDLAAPWARVASASDACETGWGVCEREITTSEAKDIGQWNERWRFTRLPPE
eukprot:6860764-Heterocapsa_arctica.AAC.1